MENGANSYTPYTQGNIRATSKTVLCDWAVKEWKSLSSDLIIKSFRVCGRVSDVNIDVIQCLQEGKSLSEGKQVLRDLLALAPNEIDNANLKKKNEEAEDLADPFADIEEDLLEEDANEILIDDFLGDESDINAGVAVKNHSPEKMTPRSFFTSK